MPIENGRGVRRKTHASFFSGVGGMDIGLERAGWQTVSFSEIEPYPCAVLAERWPDVPNLGDITRIADVPDATLWTGGFPCQDLSVAGQRKGFIGERSVLAFTFLDLVERHRPEAFILENVPGLLSSNAGRDFGRLLREVGDLGYGWAYRVLDAQWFGVPQRRRRVFILALDLDRHPDADSAAEVLAIGTSCRRDHQAERAAWSASAGRAGRGAEIVRQAISSKWSKQASGPAGDEHHHLVYGSSPDAAGVRAPDGMAGRMDDLQPLVADTLNSGGNTGGFRTEPGAHLAFGTSGPEDDLLPLGLDSHRYRCCGNGVVSDVAEFIGARLAAIA